MSDEITRAPMQVEEFIINATLKAVANAMSAAGAAEGMRDYAEDKGDAMSALTPEEWATACRQGDRLKELRKAYTRARLSHRADTENPSPWAGRKEDRSRADLNDAARKIRKALAALSVTP